MKKRLFTTVSVLILTVLTVMTSVISVEAAFSPDNLYDFYKSYCGTIDASGAYYYDINYQTSDFIPVSAGDVITAGPFMTDQNLYLIAYDASKKIVSRITSVSGLTSADTFASGKKILSYKVPSGVSSVKLTLKACYWNTFVATKNNAFKASDYNSYIEKQGLKKYIDFIDESKSAYASHSIAWYGDSVGNGSYESKYEGAKNAGVSSGLSYVGRVTSLLGMGTYNKLTSGGRTITTKGSSNIPAVMQTKKTLPQDIIVIQGGTVDLCGYKDLAVPCGYLSESYDLSSFAGPETLIGGLERCFYYATQQYPDSAIVYVNTYEIRATRTGLWGWDRIWQYVEPVCKKWGIPFIDLYHNDTINEAFDHDRSYQGLFYYDDLHCTPHGYTVCALEIAMQLKNLLSPYDKSARVAPKDIPERIAKATWACPNPGTIPVQLKLSFNLWDQSKATKGVLNKDGKSFITSYSNTSGPYYTSDFIPVSAGDKIYFGPCNPYELCQMTAFDGSKQPLSLVIDDYKNGTTPCLTGLNLQGYTYFTNGLMSFCFTVPDSVKYIRVTALQSVSPLVTKNRPFTDTEYNTWVRLALAGKLNPDGTENKDAPVITNPPVTEPVNPERPVTPLDRPTKNYLEGLSGHLNSPIGTGDFPAPSDGKAETFLNTRWQQSGDAAVAAFDTPGTMPVKTSDGKTVNYYYTLTYSGLSCTATGFTIMFSSDEILTPRVVDTGFDVLVSTDNGKTWTVVYQSTPYKLDPDKATDFNAGIVAGPYYDSVNGDSSDKTGYIKYMFKKPVEGVTDIMYACSNPRCYKYYSKNAGACYVCRIGEFELYGSDYTPVTTQKPIITTSPVITTEKPIVTTSPVITTEKPIVTTSPVITTEKPIVTTAPESTAKPVVTTSPDGTAGGTDSATDAPETSGTGGTDEKRGCKSAAAVIAVAAAIIIGTAVIRKEERE